MWRMEPTNGWMLSGQQYWQSNADEMTFLMRNISHYMAQLRVVKEHKSVEALYLHEEASAIYSIDGEGMGSGPGSLLAYVFPDESLRILYLLCVGNVADKNADMEFSKTAVFYILNERTKT
jgi:hypothetical protein